MRVRESEKIGMGKREWESGEGLLMSSATVCPDCKCVKESERVERAEGCRDLINNDKKAFQANARQIIVTIIGPTN